MAYGIGIGSYIVKNLIPDKDQQDRSTPDPFDKMIRSYWSHYTCEPSYLCLQSGEPHMHCLYIDIEPLPVP